VFAVPVASATTEATMTWLRDRRLTTVVATPDAETLVTEVDLTRGVAIVVGAEHSGLSAAWLGAADVAAAIPMSGRVNSLNVATSAAIVVYEAVRQRALVVDPSG
jgi:TrmH family RNA methyltransferase